MAFTFANAASGNGAFGGAREANNGVHVEDGVQLPEVETDELGFSAINGEAQVRLLPKPWPSEDLPPSTASLLSVASRKGLVAAGGPDSLVVASTDNVRDAFRASRESPADKLRNATTLANIPFEGLSHVAFNADESVLVVASHGALHAFQVDHIKDDSAQPALKIESGPTKVNIVSPNPAPDFAHLVAVVTSDADLMMIDLATGQAKEGKDGTKLIRGVTCVSWSNKGKQLIAGLSDGTAIQLKPDGTEVARIPKSTSIADGSHISGISWLENDCFFVTYTTTDTSDGIPPSEYWIVDRNRNGSFTFHQLPEILLHFGVERLPSSHFILRLRSFPPHIQDLLIVGATTSTDIGLVAKSDKSLSSDTDAKDIFTGVIVSNDSRRAQLPLSSDMGETSPIGMALDLSSKENVPNPIPSDGEVLETKGPIPSLMILNNEGILVAWWLIYNDSVREGTLFSGLESMPATPAREQTISPPTKQEASAAFSTDTSTQSPFANNSSTQSPFANQSSFPKPATSTFGSIGSSNTLGNTTNSTFGSTSTIGGPNTSWTSAGFSSDDKTKQSTGGFGVPGFGSATSFGTTNTPSFGSASAVKPQLPFIQAPSSSSATFGQSSTFGGTSQASNATAPAKSPFGAQNSSSTSGFASFSNAPGFGGFGGFGTKSVEHQGSPFANATGAGTFSKSSSDSPFAAKAGTTFGQGPFISGDSKPAFGSGGSFKLESSFAGDGTAKDDLPKPKTSTGFGFGGFGNLLNPTEPAVSATRSAEAEMSDDEEVASSGSMSQDSEKEQRPVTSLEPKKLPQTLVTPPASLGPPKATPAPSVSNLFGSNPTAQTTTPFSQAPTTGWSFGKVPSTTPKESPSAPPKPLFGAPPPFRESAIAAQKTEPSKSFASLANPTELTKSFGNQTRKIKEEPQSDDEAVDLGSVPEAPLPPDPVSKPPFSASADVSASSKDSMNSPPDAPLPPDFLPANKSATSRPQMKVPDFADEDDEDEFSSDFEGSEEDASGDISPIEDPAQDNTSALQMSPESSMKSETKSQETSPIENVFSTDKNMPPPRTLFGEIKNGPVFPPPKPMQSPRSPSPVRNLLSAGGQRAEPPRSVSSPVPPKSIIDQRKAEYSNSAMALQAAKAREEQIAQERARQEAQMKSKALIIAKQEEPLEDDEDEKIRNELEAPVSPTPTLDPFIPYQSKTTDDGGKSGIPAQIERLYQDINSMVYVLGINARSLSSFIEHQQNQDVNVTWPETLQSESPMDVLGHEMRLSDARSLRDAYAALESVLNQSEIADIAGKIQQCQTLLSHDVLELRTKLMAMRKILLTRTQANIPVTSPLSAEQASIQHDLRKLSASVQTKLVQMEDSLAVLRAKLAENDRQIQSDGRQSMLGRASAQKKPTVEAVTNTIAKMTLMAEKKSADIDVLEAQLKKLNTSLGSPSTKKIQGTPVRDRQHTTAVTPKSATSSVYHTPDSRFGSSSRSTPARALRTGQVGSILSEEDKQRYRAKADRQKAVADMLKCVLEERRARQKK